MSRQSDGIAWTFKNGKKFPAGVSRSRGVSPRKVMESTSSNGLTKYLTILWNDGVITCDCRGWAILKKTPSGEPKPRTCKHCKAAAANGNSAMTAVDDFAPSQVAIPRKQLDFSERQPRKITLRAK